jgi:hypothetical protein
MDGKKLERDRTASFRIAIGKLGPIRSSEKTF